MSQIIADGATIKNSDIGDGVHIWKNARIEGSNISALSSSDSVSVNIAYI